MTLNRIPILADTGFRWSGRSIGWGQLLVVFGVWAVLLVVSTAWLPVFRFGPLEWLWRFLTYGRAPALRTWPGHSAKPPAVLRVAGASRLPGLA